MRKLLVLVAILLAIPIIGWSADSRPEALTELTAPVGTDIVVAVGDPGGTPATKKMTLDTLRKLPVMEVTGSCTVGTDCGGGTSTDVLYGGAIYATAASTITLPTAVAGQSFCVYVKDASEVVRINPNASEVITLNGTALTGGVDIYSSGTAGDFICLFSPANGGWTSMGRSGVWTSGS